MNTDFKHPQPVRYRVSMYRKDSYRAVLMIREGIRPRVFDNSGEFIEIDVMARSKRSALRIARRKRPLYEVYKEPHIVYGGNTISFGDYEF